MSLVRNTWYMLDWSKSVADQPVGRIVLNEPVVAFRGEDGSIAALRDVCPHRAVPLSAGTVCAGRIRCPYHGIEFDAGGICRNNPHVKGPPERLKVAAYPVEERYGMIWIWPGDPAKADSALIPDYHWFDDSARFTVGTGYLHIQADYRLVIDNLMDLAHAEYIHVDTVGSPGASQVQEARIERNDDGITVYSLWPNLPPSAVNRKMWGATERVDQYQDMRWRAASNLFLNLGTMLPGSLRESGFHTPSAHILTPETERSTHYFWAFARNFELGNDALTDMIVETVGRAFITEDKPMIEAAQLRIEQTGAKLTNFSIGDAASAQVRREIDRLASQEA